MRKKDLVKRGIAVSLALALGVSGMPFSGLAPTVQVFAAEEG